MGTNFYVLDKNIYIDLNDVDLRPHIGRRSAAGPYCWDCDRTLCKEGNSQIHMKSTWFDNCPSCEKSKVEGTDVESSGLKELGFNRQTGKKTGIASCSSFSWAIEDPVKYIIDLEDMKNCDKKIVVDEYGYEYSAADFLKIILEDCPVRFYHCVGEWFC